MKTLKSFSVASIFLLTIHSCEHNVNRAWNSEPQKIPGRVHCEFYDTGGEGISYHDMDSVNNGSGRLNPVNGSYYNEFRMHEGVDISYTKANGTDDSPFNVVMPEMDQLYVGWTEPGEWIDYTVDVKESGKYRISLMYTSNRGGEIELVNDENISTGIMQIPTTYHDADTLEWRQWHHWNKSEIGSIILNRGRQLIRLKTMANGNMNYDYLEFTPAD